MYWFQVIKIDRDHDGHDDHPGDEANEGAKRRETKSNRQRASLLLELQAMIRIRSPYTVNVYGAMTGRTESFSSWSC